MDTVKQSIILDQAIKEEIAELRFGHKTYFSPLTFFIMNHCGLKEEDKNIVSGSGLKASLKGAFRVFTLGFDNIF